VKSEPGTYVLVLHLAEPAAISVGRLGEFRCPAGFYLYFGSARNGLRPRVARHLRREKRRRWHIDYLLEKATIVEVWHTLSAERLECSWCRAALDAPGANVLIHGFGSSDCSCPAHLLFYQERPSLSILAEAPGAPIQSHLP